VSTAGGTGGRVRKNSVAGNPPTGMRPRANTISHVDGATLGMIAQNANVARNGGLSHHQSLSHLPGVGGFEYRGMSTGLHGPVHGLPKLDTHGMTVDMSGGLRTAPPFGGFGSEFDIDFMFSNGTTINPAQLHFGGSPPAMMDAPASPYQHGFHGMSASQAMIDDEGTFDWVNGFDSQMSFSQNHENAIDGSSPSAMSTTSQSGISEAMIDGSNNMATTTGPMWPNGMVTQAQMSSSPFALEFPNPGFPEMTMLTSETVSPKTLLSTVNFSDSAFATPPPLPAMSPTSLVPGMANHYFHPPMAVNGGTSSASTSSITSSNMHSSITSISTDSITDATRQALLMSLSQPSVFGHRTYSQPSMSSPLSPSFNSRSKSFSSASLPSTADLQRYISAYIQFFHPHLPFLHIPSLNFNSPAYTSSLQPGHGNPSSGVSGIAGGGGCLILAMAAIGALYDFDNAASKELFEAAKKMIQLYLEERRKADLAAALNGTSTGNDNSVQNTPLWLVQAMLLNVIYGHNCGDKTSADIASTHCAALVSLARAAELARPLAPENLSNVQGHHQYGNGVNGEDVQMNGMGDWSVINHDTADDQSDWLNWRLVEERKRTLYTVFILSSLLVSAYNHAPALTNSEIRLDLPCDEDLWAAENAQIWRAKGGAAMAEQKATPFATALSSLLTASQRQQYQHTISQHQPFGSGVKVEDLPESDLKPSTFGCLVLINALHNYIWETRQRHLGRQWTTQETEAMHAHIEPALRAWQAAWASNPQHSLERPNPFGMGPLSADSIPLLDLAYVRLFVNLGRSKEAFWQRDWDAMADELARGAEIVQHADYSPSSENSNTDASDSSMASLSRRGSIVDALGPTPDINLIKTPTQEQPITNIAANQVRRSGQSSKRERHLRKAAFYAADSLSMSDKLGVTYAEFTSRELPLQCAMCAFDCAQVLAEWVSTVQERVGRYLGILGKDEIEYGAVPGIMLLEDEDCKLLEKIQELLNSAEMKMTYEIGGMASLTGMTTLNGLPSATDGGYGSKILMVTAHMLERAAVWPGTMFLTRLRK
jgi:hypothetical protein